MTGDERGDGWVDPWARKSRQRVGSTDMHLGSRAAKVLSLAFTAVCVWGAASASRSAAISVLPPPPASCAARQPRSLPVQAWPAVERELLPRGAAVIRLCRYGASSTSLRLRKTRLIRSQRVVLHLEKEFDALPEQPPGGETSPCPADNAASVWAYASYFRGHRATVAVSLTGCKEAGNGYLVASASEGPGQRPSRLGPRLVEDLEALTGCAPIRVCKQPSPA
jgi:hypothetical protein